MIRDAIAADFNKQSRLIDIKITLLGDFDEVVVTKDNYLIDASWLHETSADSTNIFGDISSDEISFSLYNTNDIFNPDNTASIYYDYKLSKGQVALFGRPVDSVDEINWIPLGYYYVTDWRVSDTKDTVDIVAVDGICFILNTQELYTGIAKDTTFDSFLSTVLDDAGYSSIISPALNIPLAYGYMINNMRELLQKLCDASLSFMAMSTDGNDVLIQRYDESTITTVITDDDQIISMQPHPSAIRPYSNVTLVYSLPFISDVMPVATVKDIAVGTDPVDISNIALNKKPLVDIAAVSTKHETGNATLTAYSGTQNDISLSFVCATDTDIVSADIFGRIVDKTEVSLGMNSNSFKIYNDFIQNETYANTCYTVFRNLCNLSTPFMSVKVRGNLLLKVGEKVHVQSPKYNADFVGVIQRIKYSYNGALSSELILMNASIFTVEGGGTL